MGLFCSISASPEWFRFGNSAVATSFSLNRRLKSTGSILPRRAADTRATASYQHCCIAGEAFVCLTQCRRQWRRRQDLVPGGAQKLLGVFTRRLAAYSRCQTRYSSKYTRKKLTVVSRRGARVPVPHSWLPHSWRRQWQPSFEATRNSS